MNTQQAFDIMVEHLRQQGRPSRDEVDGCQYRGPGGLKCAVGALIPDELYNKTLENNRIERMLTVFKHLFPQIQSVFSGIDTQFLDSMQTIHDCYEPERWESEFKLCAEEFGLNYTAPQGV